MIGRMLRLAMCVWLSSEALAQVDEGWQLYQRAEFAAALEAFDAAEARESLTLEDWVRVLEGRALVFFALENLDAMGSTLSRLARVAPDHALAPDAPPEIVRAFLDARDRITEPLRLELEAFTDALRAGAWSSKASTSKADFACARRSPGTEAT